jgi:hypothetical protein
MRIKLTDIGLRSYQPRPKGYSIGDSACPGLCIRITTNGVKSFAYAYRDKTTGKTVWLTIGHYPDVTLAKAREIANDTRKALASGTPQPKRSAAQKKLRRPTPTWSSTTARSGWHRCGPVTPRT